MKLTAVGILKWNGDSTPPVFLGMAVDVMNFGYFQRGTVREGILFLARTIVQRTQPGVRQTVKSEEYYCHVHVKDSGLAGVVVADGEYPPTGAFSVIGKVLDEFMERQGSDDSWRTVEADSTLANTILDPALIKYQVCLGATTHVCTTHIVCLTCRGGGSQHQISMIPPATDWCCWRCIHSGPSRRLSMRGCVGAGPF